MQRAFYWGRHCLRRNAWAIQGQALRCGFRCRPIPRRFPIFPKPPQPRGTTVTLVALLSPAAFVALSEADTSDGKTPEEHMLEASRAEIAKELPADTHGLKKLWFKVALGFDLYIFEPVATALRFLHLAIIFLPVIVTVPALWIGPRQPGNGTDRAGTLWWYAFLVRSMERAGPAFIKVRNKTAPLCHDPDSLSWANGQLPEVISFLTACAARCHHCTQMHPHTHLGIRKT